MKAVVTAYMNHLGDDHSGVMRKLGEPIRGQKARDDLYKCRVPIPATVPAVFIYKGQGAEMWPHFRVNEIASTLKAKAYSDSDNQYHHVRIPEVYCYNDQLKTTADQEKQEDVYICLEYFPDTRPYVDSYRWGCRGWTFRQKRAFVRQMALFRIQLLTNRGDYIGGNSYEKINGEGFHVSLDIKDQSVGHRKKGKKNVLPPGFYQNLGGVAGQREWVLQCISRERADARAMSKVEWNAKRSRDYNSLLGLGRIQAGQVNPMGRTRACNRLQTLMNNVRKRKFREITDEILGEHKFCMNHGDLSKGFNVMMSVPENRIVGVIDWEMAMMVPYSYALDDIFKPRDPTEIQGWLANPSGAPFELGDIEDYINVLRAERTLRDSSIQDQESSEMSKNNFRLYGDLTPYDLRFGDRFVEEKADEPEPPDTLERFYPTGEPEFGNEEWVQGQSANYLDPRIWYYEPVLSLVDRYMQNFEGVNPTDKYMDLFVKSYCTDIGNMVNYMYATQGDPAKK